MVHRNRDSLAPVPSVVEEPGSRALQAVTHLASRAIDFALKKSESDISLTGPEVGRGIFRVHPGTEPEKAPELAHKYSYPKAFLIRAIVKRRARQVADNSNEQ